MEKSLDCARDDRKGKGGLIRDGEGDGTITIDNSVTSSDGKHYTKGNQNSGYNKED